MTQPTPLSGAALKAARARLNLSREEFGRAVGLAGAPRSVQIQVSQWEGEHRPIPLHVAIIVDCLLQGARPFSFPKKS